MNEGKGPTIIPARYHCHPAGKPEFFDRKYDRLYNARRDSLEQFWKDLYGRNHAIAQITSFFENVKLHDYEQREPREGEEETNIVLHFNPQPEQRMSVACLYSRWDDSLVSFAAITDEPPSQIAAVGHPHISLCVDADLANQLITSNAQIAAHRHAVMERKIRALSKLRGQKRDFFKSLVAQLKRINEIQILLILELRRESWD
jgi:signal-transduction protein with cAMP-binding, CBS, and nucleotidyltransferase domain